MPKVVFFFRGGRAELLERIAAQQSPREFLYGCDVLEDLGWEVSYAQAAAGDSRWLRRLTGPFERALSAWVAASFTPSNALVHWQKTRDADVLISTNDGNLLALLFFKKLGLIRGQILGITQGLYEVRLKLDRRPLGRVALQAIGSLLRQASFLVVLGEGDERAVREHFGELGLPPLAIAQFGADEEFWTPGENGADGPILSVGTDHLRDYPTLLRAAADWPVRIVTRQKLPPELVGPQVRIDGNVDDRGLRDLYRQSRFVVVPIKNAPRDSGHSVTVQAMACGKAVILSDTPGLWDNVILRDGEHCLLVPPEDPSALRAAMQRLWDNPAEAERLGRNARQLIETQWSARHFGQTLNELAHASLRG